MSNAPADSLCSICDMGFDSLAGATVEEPTRCPKCERPAHADCWLERGGCGSRTCNPTAQSTHLQPRVEAPDPSDGAPVDDVIQILDVKPGAVPAPGGSVRRSAPHSISPWEGQRRSGPDIEITIRPEDVGAPRPAPPVPNAGAPGSVPLGPTGKTRSPGAVVALHILTAGLYHIRWVYAHFHEATVHADGRRGVRIQDPGTVVAVHVATPLIIGLLGTALYYLSKGGAAWAPMASIVATIALALPFAIPGWVQTAALVSRMRAAGGASPKAVGNSASAAWWMLIPVAGALVFCAIVQERTNTYWQKEAAGR